jgi:hypothetical protein
MFAASKSGRVAAAAATDPYFPYVPLLLETTSTNGQQNNTFLDSSTNNYTITRNGTPTQGSVTPYWPNGQWSNYFNGSGDYLTGTSPNLSGTWTIEFWWYPTSVSTQQTIISFNAGAFSGINIYCTTSGQLNVDNGVTGQSSFTTVAFTANQWNHVAIVRNVTTTTGYINGAVAGSHSFTPSTTSAFSIGRFNNPTYYYVTGYLSNVRVVNGTAVYTGAFTPPTTPLTAITNTSLLTCQSNRFIDNSTNAFTITANGTPKVQAFQPFAPAASYSAATYGGSGYFNGTTDYLTGTSPSMSGTWTVELWWYPITASTQQTIISFNNGSNGGINIFRNTSNQIGADDGISASPVFTGGTIATNVWNHIAIVRNGLTTTGYINGVSVGSNTFTPATVSAFQIARYNFVSAPYLCSGYISNLRVVVGTAVYTSAFTPPTAPVTAITNTSLLLNCTNAGIYDAAVQNNAITVGDAQASTTVSKWSPTSMKFDGTGDWLTAIDNPQLQLGTGNFTIDGWVYLSATGVAYGIISKGTASTGWSVNVTVLNKLQFSYTTSNLTGTTTLATGTWYYFAVVRSGSATGNLKVYLNGAVDATSGGAVTDNFNQTNILYVGADRVGATPLNGYLQDVRVTKYARTITTPTAAFPTR